jgi:hypothetical protein
MADGALYESKGAGRNRTTVAHPTLAEGADRLLSDLEPTHSPAVEGPTGGDGTRQLGQEGLVGHDTAQPDPGDVPADEPGQPGGARTRSEDVTQQPPGETAGEPGDLSGSGEPPEGGTDRGSAAGGWQ